MPSGCLTDGCRRAPAVCDECVRALALQWWGAIARHPEELELGDARCLLCEQGPARWCERCAIAGHHGVENRREQLRAGGVRIGEPDNTNVARISLEQLAELQAAARRGGWEGW
jgi:hypothetical protein